MAVFSKLIGIQENISLADYTTFKIGGSARYFFVSKNQEEIIPVLKWAKENKLPFFILAGGSNILFSDKGFGGLVIKFQISSFKFQNNKIIANAGASLSKLVAESVGAGLTGLEWAIGIPGTIGGAVFGNAGAYGYSISESVDKVITISPDNFLIKEYTRDECEFVYRGSIFKNKNEIIIGVILSLRKGDKAESQKKIREAIDDRRKKTPPYPSTGCYFKNYVLQKENDILIKNFPELVSKVKGGKIGVGYLIDQCGLKGKQINNAKISEEHANFIVNLGGATAKDVLALADLCKQKVFEKYRIKLEEETRLIGF